ncbi:MAG: IS200/IS605 family transposase [Bacteroidales bacterium]|nr:IS200/IS605 family transposase [Bacteroidales bacterium]
MKNQKNSKSKNTDTNTYTQIHIQTVFAVRYREALIEPSWRERLYQYLTAIVQEQGHQILAVGGTVNHIHILFGMRPTQSLSSLMLRVKRETSEWINQQGFCQGDFAWQTGYGAFSYSKSQVPKVVQYIQNQECHHAKRTFREEYLDMLKKAEVEFDEKYIFEDVS